MPKDAYEMSEAEVRSRVITLGFDGDERLFIAFYRKLQQGLPEGTGIVLRGSVVTNTRHEDSAPFDSLGKGTSDLDVTLVGKTVMIREPLRDDHLRSQRLQLSLKALRSRDPADRADVFPA